MYLKRLYLESHGAIKQLLLEAPFDGSRPLPLVVLGGNGSGKTNLLSVIADALFEAAAKYFTDVVPNATIGRRPWFRIVGPTTITAGDPGSCALAEFINGQSSYFFKEKAGTLSSQAVIAKVPESLKGAVGWADEGAVKEFGVSDLDAKAIFEKGVHFFCPSSRSESPHWLNTGSLPSENFDLTARIERELQRPIFVEKGLAKLKQWLLALLVHIRVDMVRTVLPDGNVSFIVSQGSIPRSLQTGSVWNAANTILQLILNDAEARFVSIGAGGSAALGYQNSKGYALPLETLSAGQGTLLAIFGTILRYGEGTVEGAGTPEQLQGMCVIDEIDAHMHVDLQYRALPALIKLFPKIQFIVSSHSPLFVLGLEKTMGDGGLALIELPSGVRVQAEGYSEFGRAFELLRQTQEFNQILLVTAGEKQARLLVLTEGETDPIYLRTAIEVLAKDGLDVDIEWIGAKDPKTGNGFHTGKDALNATLSFLKSKPDLVRRPILLLYDNDAKKTPESFGRVHVKSLAINPENRAVVAGIENLLPETVFVEEMFDTKEDRKPNGTSTIVRSLNKMRLCGKICGEGKDEANFAAFGAVLSEIEKLLIVENA
jgi:hypothetical protein